MKIQQIQNNNTNFQGLHANKRVMQRLTPEFLHSPEIQECADKFEVLITEKEGGSLINRMLGIVEDLVLQVGEGIKNTGGKLELTGVKTDKYAITDEFITHAKNVLINRIINEENAEKIKKYVIEGKIDLLNDNISFYQLSKILSPADYEEAFNSISKLQMKQDKDGNLPLHKIHRANQLYDLNNHFYLKNNTEDLAEIYLTRNNRGELPIHNRVIMDNVYALRDIAFKLMDYSRVLVTIFEAKNSMGVSPLEALKAIRFLRHTDEANQLIEMIKDAKQDCINARGSFIPAVAKKENAVLKQLENEMNAKFDYKGIMGMLKNPHLQSTNGVLLNYGNNISKIIGFVINEANADESKAIIAELKKLPEIDYNKMDKNDISVVENIMNAENFDLLELLKGKSLDYSPELDFTYNRIENKDFKVQVDELNFEFKNLENAVRVKSIKAIEQLRKNFSSPLFKKDYNGKKLYELLTKTSDSNFRSEFIKKYGKYISDYFV